MRETLARFLRRFAHLYDSGVPLAEALDLTGREFPGPLGDVSPRIVDDLYRGSSLADALDRHPQLFGPTLVGFVRSGEQRGELGAALRSAAEGLSHSVLDPVPFPDARLDEFLEAVGDTRAFTLDVGDAAADALLVRAQGQGGFVWRGRLLRVARAGLTVVVRCSRGPGAEPPEAAAWRAGRPCILLVTGGREADVDRVMRSVLAHSPGRCVAVGFPEIPEALSARDLDHAFALDPDLLCLAALRRTEERDALLSAVDAGIHVLCSAPGPRMLEGCGGLVTTCAAPA